MPGCPLGVRERRFENLDCQYLVSYNECATIYCVLRPWRVGEGRMAAGATRGGFRMLCPFCGEPDSKVLDSRSIEEGACIRRRRECESCARRFTTHERHDEIQLMVVKKDGTRELFDQQKVIRGIMMACTKRSVPVLEIERIAAEVEREARNSCEREVESSKIGEMVMDRLQKVDQVAYVRFASVYRQFTDLSKFKQELERLL